ncbi:MAG: dihydroneopterin aldolase [Kiritimatiellaeota bacterium]|nr:dihydroneopterin aldolase [Kiritimatiellota bacterium]
MTLTLKNLPITTILGAYPEERGTPQTILLTLALDGDFSKPAATDSLADALDYHALWLRLADLLNAAKPRLIEHAARLVADHCLTLPNVAAVTVTLEKPNVPVPGASAVFQSKSVR